MSLSPETYKWLFDGVGGALLLSIIGFFIHRWVTLPKTASTKVQGRVQAEQSATNNSPIAVGSGISQTVNAPTVHLNIGNQADVYPDVLLQCEWRSMLRAGPPLPPSFYVVRKRLWALSVPGGGPVYNVRIGDIDFGGFVVGFRPVDVLTKESVSRIAEIFDADTKQLISTHDLESLMTHPTPECDIKRYTNPQDPMDVQIPISVEYADARGNRYVVDYDFKYDLYFEEGRMVRNGGIKRL